MKLKLSQKLGVSILALKGALTPGNLKAIRAGVHKLFKDGKNRMVLDLREASGLSHDFIREFCFLNVVARELAGELVLLISDSRSKDLVDSFSNPRSISVYSDLSQAVTGFVVEDHEDPAKGEDAPEDKKSAGDAALEREIKALKFQLSEKEKGDVQRLKTENESLKQSMEILVEQVLRSLERKAVPPEGKDYEENIRVLEDRIRKLVEEVPTKPS